MISRHRLLFENVSSLYLLQISNYLIPIVVLPYLVRTLGGEQYGLMVFSFALTQYFVLLTDYGFNLSATRRVAIHRAETQLVSEIFWSVLLIKAVIAFVSFAVLSLIVFGVAQYAQNATVFLVSFITVIGNVLFPIWLLQGLERIKLVALLSFAGRLLSLAALFAFVKGPADIVTAVAIQAMGTTVSGVVAFIVILNGRLVAVVRPSLRMVVDMLKDGWPVFISQVSVSLFANTGVFLIGNTANYEAAGQFAIADKIVKAVAGFATPIVNGVYPRVSSLFATSRQAAVVFLRKILAIGGGLMLACSIGIFVFAAPIAKFIAGQSQPQIALMVRVMSVIPFSAFIDNIYGTQILLNIERSRTFMIIILLSGIASLIGLAATVPFYGSIAAAIVFTATELLILWLMVAAVRSSGIRLLSARTTPGTQ